MMIRPRAWFLTAVAIAAPLLVRSQACIAAPWTAEAAAARHAATQPTTQTSPGVYLSERFKFTLTVPADWKELHKVEIPPIILALTAGDPASEEATSGEATSGEAATAVRVEYRPRIRVKLETMLPGIEETAAAGDPKAQSSSIGAATLGGNPAKEFTVVKKIKGIETRTVYILTVKDGHLYTFAIENDAGHDPLPDTIAKSFKFTN